MLLATPKHMKLILSMVAILSVLQTPAFAGETGSTIIGGSNVQASSVIARRTVALFMINAKGEGSLCTGSIVNDKTILTAAHCIYGVKGAVVVFGTGGIINTVKRIFAQQQPARIGPNYRIASKIQMVSGYSPDNSNTTEYTDLALVSFDGGLPQGYEAAQFLNQANTLKSLQAGSPVVLAGYGITSKEERDSKSKTGPDTSGTLRQVTVAMNQLGPRKINLVFQGQINKDACSGDSGGPAMVAVNNQVYVIGVASRSDCVTSSIYTWVPREKVQSLVSSASSAL